MEAGTKITLLPDESPSQQVIAAGNTEVIVQDSTGRSFTLKKPGVLAQFRMIEMLGPVRSDNERYVSMALPFLYLTAIDGEAVPPVTTHRELEALIQRVDEHGLMAVMEGVEKNFRSAPQADKDAAVKN